MALNPKQISRLLKMIEHTQEVELTCPECLDHLDWYTQVSLDGAPLDGLLVHVKEHLAACPCCNGQFQLVLDTLDAVEDL